MYWAIIWHCKNQNNRVSIGTVLCIICANFEPLCYVTLKKLGRRAHKKSLQFCFFFISQFWRTLENVICHSIYFTLLTFGYHCIIVASYFKKLPIVAQKSAKISKKRCHDISENHQFTPRENRLKMH